MPSADLPPLRLVAAVAAGGAVGGSARTWLYLAFAPTPGALPWVTLLENVTGAFLLGFAATVLLAHPRVSRPVSLGVTTGLLGSYTTFSALAVELRVLAVAAPLAGLLYLAATLVLGLAAAAAGVAAGRLWPGRR